MNHIGMQLSVKTVTSVLTLIGGCPVEPPHGDRLGLFGGDVVQPAGRFGQAAELLVFGEFPYLTRETPGLPSILQGLYDEFGPGAPSRQPPMRIVSCGSAISVMSDLLAGTKALRGWGALELRVNPTSTVGGSLMGVYTRLAARWVRPTRPFAASR
ncbi:ATP-binding protein [Saccharomonospora halophila]|uniref:hypothetical protein n=1 Tax=Saccharomonospora halophila TaxID=129922 RepID=UPI001E5B2F75|nr:hypothetical protein [Saccharomonospora halophila]